MAAANFCCLFLVEEFKLKVLISKEKDKDMYSFIFIVIQNQLINPSTRNINTISNSSFE